MVVRVSVDLMASMPRSVALDVLVAAARETTAGLLGMATAPALAVFADSVRVISRSG
jgi:hypothetical protein